MEHGSLRTPNETYLKSRRALVATSGLLLLAVFVGITPEAADGSASFLSIKLKSADSIPFVVLVILLYSGWQYWCSWLVQTDEVRQFFINKADFFITLVIALFAIASFSWPYALRLASYVEGYATLLSVASSVVAGVLFAVTNSLLRKNLKRLALSKAGRLTMLLTEGSWILNFNPDVTQGKKDITFLPDGSIGDGENDNESRWRIQEGTLEILNRGGNVFSRFRYNDEKKRFEHTNDADTLSLRDQVIERRSE